MSLSIGFSGILFGVDAFILLTTMYGKKRFVFIKCEMKKDRKLFKSICLLTGIGIISSFLPGISFLGHMSGLIAGGLLFWLWIDNLIYSNVSDAKVANAVDIVTNKEWYGFLCSQN